MKNTLEQFQKKMFSQVRNRLLKVHRSTIATKIMRLQIENGKLPEYFLQFMKKRKTNKARNSFQTNGKLRRYIIERDRNTCKKCGCQINLEIHHKKSVHHFPHLAQQPDNLILLCRACHKKEPSWIVS